GAVDGPAAGALAAPGIRVRPRRDDLLRLGLSAAAVERAIRGALGGLPVGRVVEAGRQADVVLYVAAADDPARLARLPITAAGSRVVALGSVADIDLGPLRADIAHEDGVRAVAGRLNGRGGALGGGAHDVAGAGAAVPRRA